LQKDNSTFLSKKKLRHELLKLVPDSVVMETHGGTGKLWQACYSHIERGVVFEKDPDRAALLAKQRRTWSVYEGECVAAISAGFGAHLPVNFFDIDPYGSAWPIVDAVLGRAKAESVGLAVNDGLRQKIQLTGGWDVECLENAVRKYGNRLFDIYLDVCREMMEEKAARVGYALSRFWGNYAGHNGVMTHYAAVLKRTGASS
jgi:hypothetical protein